MMSAPQTQATLILDRIERRLSVDTVGNADWLRTTVDESGRHIVRSMRYSDDDIQKYRAEQVMAWIAEDQRRYQAFQRGEWWFVEVCAVAIIGVFIGEERIGQLMVGSMIIGGLESDAERKYLDEMTDILVNLMKQELTDRGFSDIDDVESPYVLSEPWVADAI